MELVLLAAVALVPILVPPDPAPGMAHSKAWARNLDCERIGLEPGSERYPGRIVTTDSRVQDDSDRDAVVCRERLTAPGLRSDRDEAILSTLEDRANDLASAAGALRPDLQRHTWLVETYFPSGPVSAKIGFATKNALVRRGLTVSDRTPALSASDLGVITRMGPEEAYPTACRRWSATGGLGEGDVVLAVMTLDPRETILHAGLCAGGQWTWLQ